MTEIEKMYENAGIKPLCQIPDKFCGVQNIYEDFTAEKQIELIKWLGELDMLKIMRTIREDKAWIINSEYGMLGNVHKHTSRMKSFEEALAELMNSLWEDLTDQEKEEIRGILNENS